MAAPDPGSSGPLRNLRRERLIGLLVLGVGVVLLVSSVSWFGTGRQGVGIAQLVLGVLLVVVGIVLQLRARQR